MKYIFSEKQFAALLAIHNTKKIYSLNVTEDMDASCLVEAVEFLYRTGAIENQNEQLKLTDKFRIMVEAIQNSKQVVVISSSEFQVQQLVYAMNSHEIVVLEDGLSSAENAVKIYQTSAGGYIESIVDELSIIIPAAPSIEQAHWNHLHSDYLESHGQTGTVVLQIERINVTSGKTTETIKIMADPLVHWIAHYSGDEPCYIVYSKENLMDLLDQILGGEKGD